MHDIALERREMVTEMMRHVSPMPQTGDLITTVGYGRDAARVSFQFHLDRHGTEVHPLPDLDLVTWIGSRRQANVRTLIIGHDPHAMITVDADGDPVFSALDQDVANIVHIVPRSMEVTDFAPSDVPARELQRAAFATYTIDTSAAPPSGDSGTKTIAPAMLPSFYRVGGILGIAVVILGIVGLLVSRSTGIAIMFAGLTLFMAANASCWDEDYPGLIGPPSAAIGTLTCAVLTIVAGGAAVS